jgi:hypothetical protein
MNAPDEPVLRVVGASLSLVRGSVMEELLAMRRDVGAFNAAHGLRSALLYSSGWFFQWHEGPVAAVGKVLHIAQADSRHHRPRVLHRSLGAPTLASTLQIATTHGADKPTDVARRLFHLTRGQELEPPGRPDELWRHLVAPLYLPAGVTMPALVQRHVVAVTSEYTGAVDMVRMFSDRFGLPVTYQRFATDLPQSGDVGAAYVDIPGQGCVTRLHALSRRSLAHPMVRLMLGDLHCVLLLLGERAGAASALAGEVGLLLAGLSMRPALRLAAGSPDAVREARERLQACGCDIGEIDLASMWNARPEALYHELLRPDRDRAGTPDKACA